MKVLMLYGSNFGQTEAVVRRIAAILETHGHGVRLFKCNERSASVAIEDFDAVVIAASVVVGHYQSYVVDFVNRHEAALRDRPSAFISVNGTMPESAPEWRAASKRYVEEFFNETAWTPRWIATFAGALRYREYGVFTRWIMKSISRRHGGPVDTSRDYEFTDWHAVDRFGETLAAGLTGSRAEAPIRSDQVHASA